MARKSIGPSREPVTIILLRRHSIKQTPNDIIMTISYCISQPSLDKFHLAVDENEHIKPQLINMKRRRNCGILNLK